MTSADLLLLLLALSSLPEPGIAPPVNPSGSIKGQTGTESAGNPQKKNWIKNNAKGIVDVGGTAMGMVPVVGAGLNGLTKAAMLFFPGADKLGGIQIEAEALHFKLDTVKAEIKWADYQTAVNNIEHAWFKYTDMVRDQEAPVGEKIKLKDMFFTFYSQYADSSLVLYQYLTAEPLSVTDPLGDLLADRLRCHEADVMKHFSYLNELVCKGNKLEEKYYEFKDIKTNAKIKSGREIASKSATALLSSQKQCLSNIDPYVQMDIFDLIDDSKNHQVLANTIRAFLEKTYKRYDWIVVAFSTHNSKNLPRYRKFHILSGFTEVKRGSVTVAVAKQVKGSSNRVNDVKNAIKKCLPQTLKTCNTIVEELQKCKETVLNKKVSEIYTAVHTYRHSSQTSTSAVPIPQGEIPILDNLQNIRFIDEEGEEDEEALPQTTISTMNTNPYLYTGECGKKLKKLGAGEFMILIKSDDEIMEKNPCDKLTCKNGGKCVRPDNLIAMCECQYPFYGQICEKNLDMYKTGLSTVGAHTGG